MTSLTSQGIIPIEHKNFLQIEKAKKLKYLYSNFGNGKSTSKLLKCSREDKINVLIKLSSVFEYILASLFQMPKSLPKGKTDNIPTESLLPNNVSLEMSAPGQVGEK